MKLLTFEPEKDGKNVKESELTGDLETTAQLWRETMIECLCDLDDELMTLALAEEEIPEKLIRRVLREGTIAQQIQPVLCGTALHGIGVQPVLDAAAAYLPSPLDMPPVEGILPGKSPFVGLSSRSFQPRRETSIGFAFIQERSSRIRVY
jgi:elongation factor G